MRLRHPLPLAALVAACGTDPLPVDPGVPVDLAAHRAATIANLRYDIVLDIPESADSAVTGTVTIRFDLVRAGRPLVLDFRAPPERVAGVHLDGEPVAFTQPPDHIVIAPRHLRRGPREVTVAFTSTDDALNRHQDFLYALFVPDRASTAIPVFEQPDLKARFSLALTIPGPWEGVSNGALIARETLADGRHRLRFAETEPISTYLFTFAAGRMQAETAERDGRVLTMWHRETDSTRVARNREAIFDLHAIALRWLEDYTGISYPFGKFDFFAIPAFQFGGMEHPGAVWYRAESLFLDPSASRAQELGRASLIAHETAHMWFGDLVTMQWFDDVWMKEVFANFMAAKIAGPAFPDINLALRFFQAHHPAAYAVDRTAGANPIRQDLENLREAGSLYGAIIYQKAPVVVRQLEQLVGEEALREGLRRYLDEYRFANATWPDLILILDELSAEDLSAWSRAWVTEPGRPRISVTWADSGLHIRQADDDTARGLRWTQPVALALDSGDSVAVVTVPLHGEHAFLPWPARPRLILPGADGIGYARFLLDEETRSALLEDMGRLPDPLHRAVAWQALWEEALEGRIRGDEFVTAALAAVPVEDEELVGLQVLGLLRGGFWELLEPPARDRLAPEIERVLWTELAGAPAVGQRGALFGAIQGITTTAPGLARLERIWRGTESVPGLPLSETQLTGLAEALAIRGVEGAEALLDEQERRITNPDRLARLRFMRPALSADVSRRDSLVASFADLGNRRRESWVLDAVSAMHHPLRADGMRHQIRPALELVEEIQRTGDIFFPLRWMTALLDGHRSPEAAAIVRQFLADNPGLPHRLRGKLLQASDGLFRATELPGR